MTASSLFPDIVWHLDRLTATDSPIDAKYDSAVSQLSDWIATNYSPDSILPVVVVCTGNSRRSILGSTMGNILSQYVGLPQLRFFSGGTEPSSFNPRTISALKELGIRIEPTGALAVPGKGGELSPKYSVSWSDEGEMVEFSKHYADPSNPNQGFAAIMVCEEANAECPIVKGASLRIAMPFQDPKSFDGSTEERERYIERRDQIARVLWTVLKRAHDQRSELQRAAR